MIPMRVVGRDAEQWLRVQLGNANGIGDVPDPLVARARFVAEMIDVWVTVIDFKKLLLDHFRQIFRSHPPSVIWVVQVRENGPPDGCLLRGDGLEHAAHHLYSAFDGLVLVGNQVLQINRVDVDGPSGGSVGDLLGLNDEKLARIFKFTAKRLERFEDDSALAADLLPLDPIGTEPRLCFFDRAGTDADLAGGDFLQ